MRLNGGNISLSDIRVSKYGGNLYHESFPIILVSSAGVSNYFLYFSRLLPLLLQIEMLKKVVKEIIEWREGVMFPFSINTFNKL